MRKATAMAGSIGFFLLAPGIVAGWVPWRLTGWRMLELPPSAASGRVAGAGLVTSGVAVLVHAFARFVLEGAGTPAPVAPPEQLVVGGLYRYVRNPMYLAVVAIIVGQALLLPHLVLIAYAGTVFAAVAAFVRWYEEPHLSRRFGLDYEAYRRAVPAWWPRLRRWPPRPERPPLTPPPEARVDASNPESDGTVGPRNRTPSVEDAIALAARAHRGQWYGTPESEPYVFHPLRVMLSLADPADQIVAVLHDAIEDTDVELDDLAEAGYPSEIIAAVDSLTHRADEAYNEYIERVAANDIARRVKLIDLRHNLANDRRLPASPENAERIARYERALVRLGNPSCGRSCGTAAGAATAAGRRLIIKVVRFLEVA